MENDDGELDHQWYCYSTDESVASFVSDDDDEEYGTQYYDADDKTRSVDACEPGLEKNSSEHAATEKRSEVNDATLRRKYLLVTNDYIVLKPDMLEEKQREVVESTVEILNVPFDTANVLLLQFKWNKEKLLEKYYLDPEQTCIDSGVLYHAEGAEQISNRKLNEEVVDSSASFWCPILFEDFPYEYTCSLGCGHRYSIDAWQEYLAQALEDNESCVSVTCPNETCNIVVSPNDWERIFRLNRYFSDESKLEADEKIDKYKKRLASSFVNINKEIRYCPGERCTVAIMSKGAASNVKCPACKTQFCFKCGKEAHLPTTCRWYTMWQEKCRVDADASCWIVGNTKECPSCYTRIEKNQGCNHMTCRVCKHEFCWVCMASWSSHDSGGYYTCNRWKYTENTAQDSVAGAQAKRELSRFMHCYERYKIHENSCRFATLQRSRAEIRMKELQDSKLLRWSDVQFVINAQEQLIECRRVLKHTYIHAYYIPEGKKKDLFEYLQSLLEANTEKLSELVEMPLATMNREAIANSTRVTGNFFNNLLEQVDMEGI